MPWIENVSLTDIERGQHFDAGENSMLIQIVDPDMEFPKPLKSFKEIHGFKFLDIEDPISKHSVKDEDIEKLCSLLTHALSSGMNVVVHCVVGVCRSGAVCEIGTILGFYDTEKFRSPNLLIKLKMLKTLGLSYDSIKNE